ncbi:MAG: RimK/LysX family protein [Crocinitomicaceae bacterium]|nr:RimK/LysX family protein [Crocinitomicaceae bacterium]
MDKLIIGRKEVADLPTFGLMHKIVKIDSGAYTSSIDVVSAKIHNDQLKVIFEEGSEEMSFQNYSKKRIKSSNGIIQERYIIYGKIILGGNSYETPFSLTDRSGMKYPILLGRKLLNKNFIIDTSKTNQLKFF